MLPSKTELNFVDGVTSAIQTQLALKALITDPTFIGEIGIGSVNVSETELGLLEGAIEGANKLQIGDILIQWGDTPNIVSGETIVTFPVAYTSEPKVFSIHKSVSTSSTIVQNVWVSAVSITQVTIQARYASDTGAGVTDITNTTSGFVHWVAIGINTV